MIEKPSFWGGVLALCSMPVALTIGTVKGIHNVATGKGGFEEGVDDVVVSAIEGSKKFANKHGDAMTKGAVKALTGIAVGGIAHEIKTDYQNHNNG